MAVARLRLLDKQEEDFVHAKSMECLGDIGVLIRSPHVVKMLEEHGADVDHSSGIVKMSEELVKEALSKAPKRIKLCGRDPKHDLEMPADGIPYVGTNSIGTYMTDLETGEKRTTTRKDLADFARLTDALDGMDFFWSNVTPYDVPEALHMVHAMWVAFQNCTKNYGTCTLSAYDARAQIDLAALIAGGREELKRRPLFHSLCCIVAPLSFERGAIDGQVELARAGIPIVGMSMSLAGMTAPVTVAGTVVNANAETLASLVITQCAAPGAPYIYCSESTTADMKTGSFAYESPEYPIIGAALGQMAKRYSLPCYVGGWGAGGDKPGMMLSFTETCSVVLCMFVGTDMAAGAGHFDEAKGGSLEQLVIDSYLWDNFKGFLRKFAFSDETVPLDVVKQVGHGNTFLTHPHTLKNFKKDLFIRDKKKMRWEATLSDWMVPEAREDVKRILRTHQVEPLDRDIVLKGDRLIEECERNLDQR